MSGDRGRRDGNGMPDANGMRDDARFDQALARVVRSLVTEDLPRGVLDAALAPGGGAAGAVRVRRSWPAYAGVFGAVVLLLATAIVFAPIGGPPPPPSPSPTAEPSPGPSTGASASFRSTLDIRADFMRLHYACVAGSPLPSIEPSPTAVVREGAICTAPADAGPYIAVVILGEAADGRVVDLHTKADLVGPDTIDARSAIAEPLAKSVAVAASGQAVGNQLAQWVLETAPTIEPSLGAGTVLQGFSLKIVRNAAGGYQLFMHPA